MSLLAHYKLNGDANDVSGSGFHGTPTDITYGVGRIGQAASFNGSTSRIVLPITAPSGSMTFMAWINSTTSAGQSRYLCDVETGRAIFAWFRSVDSSISYYDINAFRYFGPTPADGIWYHVAWVCDAVAGTVTCYLNGVMFGTPQTYRAVAIGGVICLGHHYLETAHTYTILGLIDDARFYNEVVPAWKVAAIYNGGKGSEECQPWQRLIRPVIQRTIRPLIGV